MVESAALTETAAGATMNAMISIENCWFIITGQSPENEGWY
jgi:hypothetical protein